MGTYHNDRKGLDLVMKAFTEEFHADESVRLLFKVNKIYDPNKSFMKYISKYMNKSENANIDIEFIDEDLSQEELVDLFNLADVYVAPHRAEGFGINILDSIATETPVITTEATGNMDFCKDNPAVEFIEVDREIYAPLINPYENAKWVEPSLKSLKRKMRNAYKKPKFDTKKGAEIVKENWTWANTVDKMEARIKELF